MAPLIRVGAAVGLVFLLGTPVVSYSQPSAIAPLPTEIHALGLSTSDNNLLAQSAKEYSEADKSRLRGLVRSLASSAPWKAEVLGRKWAEGLKKISIDLSDGDGTRFLKAMVGSFEHDETKCHLGSRIAAFTQAIDSGHDPAPPITSALAASDARCVGIQSTSKASLAFLTVPTLADQDVELLMLGPNFGRVSGLPHLRSGRWILWCAAVPVNARVLAIVRQISSSPSGAPAPVVPYVLPLVASTDAAVGPRSPACMDVSRLRTSDGATVLLNGIDVGRTSEAVELLQPEKGATVQVLDAEHKQVFTREISASRMVGGIGCAPVEGDSTAPSKKTVMVVVTTGSESCAREGVDGLKIRGEIESVLSDRYETSGVDVTEVLKTVTDVQGILTSLGAAGTAVPPPQATDWTADVARGLRDVGFSLAFNVDVRCVRPPGGDVQYTVAGQRIDLDALAEAARRESREQRMDSMRRVLTSDVETQTGDQTLQGLIEVTTGQLFGLPYVRLMNGAAADWMQPDVRLTIESLVPADSKDGWTADMQARRITKPADQVACRNVTDHNALRATGPADAPADGAGFWNKSADAYPVVSPSSERTDVRRDRRPTSDPRSHMGRVDFTLPFYPVEPGQYAVRIAVHPAHRPKEIAAQIDLCPTITEPSYSLWTELDHFENFKLPRAWAVTTTSSYLLAGAQRHTSDTYTFGGLLGFGYSVYSADGPPSWSDIGLSAPPDASNGQPGAVTYGTDGTLPLTWTRISLAGALQFERRVIRLADLVPGSWFLSRWWHRLIQESSLRASGFYLSLMPLIDLGWYQTSGIPSGLREVKGGSDRPFDVDGSIIVGLTYRVSLTDHQMLSLGFRGGWLGFDDWGGFDPRRRVHIIYDNWLAWGLTFGFGWSP